MAETKKPAATLKTEVKAETKEAAKKTATKTTTAKKSTAAKKTTTKTAEKAAKTTEKATAKKATTAKAAAKKSAEPVVHVQFSGKSYTTEDLVKIAKDVWKYDLGRKASEFKTVEIYVKPEESAAYYVINGEVEGSFAI